MKVDTKEFELPDTVYVRDIDSQVFQTIVLECLSKVHGIRLAAGGLIESLLGLESKELIKSIHIEQDEKAHAVNVKVEINIAYGLSIPAKSEEIQSLITLELTRLTGLHVGQVHVVIKNIYFEDKDRKLAAANARTPKLESEYNDEF
jgi:uncharacterized alkaline shock family protein YloU